jgi:phosphatidylglycerophosphatase A
VGVAALWITREWTLCERVGLLAALTAVGTWAARSVCVRNQTKDDQRIVIDEVIGMGVTGLTLAPNALNYALAFALFRFFDITKLPPARQADRWSKGLEFNASWRIGFGVLLDDIIAGLQGLLLLEGARRLGFLA